MRLTAANENGSTALATYDFDNLGHPAWVQYAGAAAKVSYSWSNEGDLLTLTHDLASTAYDQELGDSSTIHLLFFCC